MKLPKIPSAKYLVTTVAALVSTVAISLPAYAEHPGYVEDRIDSVVRSGFGECVQTSRWHPELTTPECGAQQVAAISPPEVTQQAAFETPRPLETLTLDARTLFEFDQATLKPDARGKLDDLAQRLNGQEEVLFVNVTGHADRIGSAEYNEMLSKQRASAVTDYLQNHTDLRSAKFEVKAAGESQPVVECDGSAPSTALIDCLEPNRRVEVEVSLVKPAGTDPQ